MRELGIKIAASSSYVSARFSLLVKTVGLYRPDARRLRVLSVRKIGGEQSNGTSTVAVDPRRELGLARKA